MTRADGIFGVWDFRRGSLSRIGLTGRRATAPPIEDGRCDGAVADVRDFGPGLVEAGRSVDGSRFRVAVVELGAVLGRGGGGMGDC
jgi:hypothetical protein